MAPKLHVHRAGGGFIGKVDVSPPSPSEVIRAPEKQIHNVVILDVSGSMGQWAAWLLQTVFPKVLEATGVQKDDVVTVITFSSETVTRLVTLKELRTLPIGRQAATHMTEVFQHLQEALHLFKDCNIRVLVLSDGMVLDQDRTVQAGMMVADSLKSQYDIEARAIRLRTSTYGEPDTRALASVLQLNTHTTAGIITLNTHKRIRPELELEYVNTIAGLFDNETSARTPNYVLKHNEGAIFQANPLMPAQDELRLAVGPNTFWMNAKPAAGAIVGTYSGSLKSAVIEVVGGDTVTQETMGRLLQDRIEYFANQLRLFQVINTPEAKEKITSIVTYFKALEASLAPPEDLQPLLASGSLASRKSYLQSKLSRRLKSVSNLLESIANDDRVHALNKAQQADYLRETTHGTKNARALARRAQTAGLDFGDTIRKEIIAMKQHLHELDTIDDSAHEVSFYSQATTVEGIRQLCGMVSESGAAATDEELDPTDLLQMFNVVGVPAVATIGDYPDPMTYRLEQICPGSYISVADLTIAEIQGQKLKVPGTNIEISNAVPVFDDTRVQAFLQTHAPATLEYMCSIGMRRVLAEVPKTFPYTVCAGIWKLVGDMDTNKSEVNTLLLQRMVPSYNESLHGYFDYLMPHLVQDQDPAKSFFLNHNGITNMISPIWRLVQSGQTQNMPRILRALYTYEIYQVVRKFCRHKCPTFITDQLDELLGVDYDARGTPLPGMFEAEASTVEHNATVIVDHALFTTLRGLMWYVKYVTLLHPFFAAMLTSSPVDAVRAVPATTDATVAAALGLTYPLEEFLVYNIVEGFLYQNKQARIDKDTGTPLRPDLGNREAGQAMCAAYITDRYRKDYELRLKDLRGQEKKTLKDALVDRLLRSECMQDFCVLLNKGITRGHLSLAIESVNSVGCKDLHSGLMNTDAVVPHRGAKLFVFHTGVDPRGNAVWNGGMPYRHPLESLKELLVETMRKPNVWDKIHLIYQACKSHVYREGSNRHNHSNERPSYFAHGCDTLTQYHEMVSSEEWTQYCTEHSTCCGVGLYVQGQQQCLLAS